MSPELLKINSEGLLRVRRCARACDTIIVWPCFVSFGPESKCRDLIIA